MPTGLVIFAHGSRIGSANDAVRSVAAAVAQAGGFPLVEAAFLDLAQPNLADAVKLLVERGADRILVLPYFLTLGLHMQRDLPAIAERISLENNSLEIRIAPPLDEHPALSEILVGRAREALTAWPETEADRKD